MGIKSYAVCTSLRLIIINCRATQRCNSCSMQPMQKHNGCSSPPWPARQLQHARIQMLRPAPQPPSFELPPAAGDKKSTKNMSHQSP